MNFRRTALSAATALTLSFMMNARPAHAAPANTGVCNDGTFSQSAEKKGACRGHKGVKEWYGDTSASQPSGKPAKSSQPMAASTQTSAPSSSASAGVPAGAKGQCNDSSYSFDAMKKGACRGHKGVKAWFAADAPTAAPAQATSPAPSPAPAPKQSAATPAPAASHNQTKSNSPAPMTQQRPGGGPGQVWVNTSTKVYHCMGDRYYGKTKEGAYMSESDAKAKGIRADAGKPCSN